MELDDIRAFVSIADAGSVSRAARELFITQSAVTRRLQRLEMSLGAALLDRRLRPVVLTATGRLVLERCRRLLNDFREVRAAAADGNLPVGEIRIGVAHAMTEFTLTEPVGFVRQRFPKVMLRVHTGWSRDLLERVRSGALDAAVILLAEGEPLPGGVKGTKIGRERLIVIAPRKGSRIRPRKIQDLAGTSWILNPEGCAARAALRRTLLRSNVDMALAVETYNYELQFALVAQDRGFSLVPARILARSRFRSRVRVLKVPGLDFPLTIWTVERQVCRGLEPVIAELRQALIKRL